MRTAGVAMRGVKILIVTSLACMALAPGAAAAAPAPPAGGSGAGTMLAHAQRVHARLRSLVTLSGGYVWLQGSFRLVVDTNGRVNLRLNGRRPRVLTLSAARLRRLRGVLRAAHFGSLRHRYTHVVNPVVGDRAETISYAGRTVTIAPGASSPRRLAPVLAWARAFVAVHR